MLKPDNETDDAMLDIPREQWADDRLRSAVLAQTLGVMRRRRRWKRCGWAAGLVGCYLAGITTAAFWTPAFWTAGEKHAAVAIGDRTTVKAESPAEPAPAATEPSGREDQQSPEPMLSGFEHWRRLGDHFLRDSNDISLAAQSYSQALALATEEERAISSNRDNWLFMALKQSQIQEKQNASVQN